MESQLAFLPKQPLETRLAAVIETVTSTHLGALDDDDKATAKLYVQKAAQAADEAWQQTIGGLQGPSVTNSTVSALEHPSSASQDKDSEDMDFSAPRKSRVSAPKLQAQLSRTDRTPLRRLKSTLLSKGAWQRVTRTEDLCHTHVSPKCLYHFDACAGRVLDAARLHHQRAEKTWKHGVDRIWRVPLVSLLPGPTAGTWRNLQHRRSYAGDFVCVHAVVCGRKLADPGITTEPRGLTASQARLTDIFTTTAVPGRSAALDVCVASSNAAAARGDAAQASFDRKLSHYRYEISHSPSLSRLDRGRATTPAVTRTLRDAADVESESDTASRCRRKSLQRRWTHVIQIALLRRRAAMTNPVLPLLHGMSGSSPVSSMGPCTTGVTSTLLTVDLATKTMQTPRLDTAIPDDDDDIAFLGSQSFEPLQRSSF